MKCNYQGADCDRCDRDAVVKGTCRMHYMRTYKRKWRGGAHFNPDPRSLWKLNVHPKAVHGRCWRLWGPARDHPCVTCGQRADEWAYDGTDPTEVYKLVTDIDRTYWVLFSRFPEFYMPLCICCHRTRDKRAAALIVHEYRLRLQETRANG